MQFRADEMMNIRMKSFPPVFLQHWWFCEGWAAVGGEGGLCKLWNFDSDAVEWTGELKYAAAAGDDSGWQLYLPQEPFASSYLMNIARVTLQSWGHCA